MQKSLYIDLKPINRICGLFELYQFFPKFSGFYAGGRYPDEDGDICFQADKDEAEKNLCQTKEVFQWLLNSMPLP
jgi:hypothetical protein